MLATVSNTLHFTAKTKAYISRASDKVHTVVRLKEGKGNYFL